MRKFLLFIVLLAFGWNSSEAQTVSLSLLTPACDSNGVVVATFTGLTYPMSVYWSVDGNYAASTTVSAATDTLYGFTGGVVTVDAYGSGSGYAIDSANYSLPFSVHIAGVGAACPALGTLTATITGGTGPFTYKWITSYPYTLVGTTNPMSAGTGYYSIRVTDMSTGCVTGFGDTAGIYISPDFTQILSATSGICPAPSSGTATVSGGTAPFSYSWSSYPSSVITTSSSPTTILAPGTYIETTTDGTGCTATSDITIAYTPDFTATVTTTSANCTNGTASVTVTGGTAPFSYLWSNGATSASLSGLVTGTYNLVLTDAIGCVDSSGMDSSLSGYVPQSIYINAPDVTTPATCIDADGSITAFGSGGTPPYSYIWSNGGTTATISGLSSAYYSVAVTDANGCIGSGGDYVSSSTPITVYYNTIPSSCTSPTGSATLVISGGTAPYTITWGTTPAQTGITATSLAAGDYYFHITDALGCTQSGVVTVPPVDVIYLSFSSTPATCLASDGSVAVSASGGVAPYTYSWASSSSTSSSLTGVPYGTYYATVTDAHGCSVTNCQPVPYSSPLELGLSTAPASCLYTADGYIVASASMGTPPYTYSSGGSASGPVVIPSLPTGNYWISVTDAMGCNAWEHTFVDYNVSDSSCFCVVKGTVYDDINHNCTQDPGEPGIQNIQLHASGFGYTYSNTDGDYYFLLPTGSYTVSQTVLSMYPLSPCQPNNIPYTSVAATGCKTTMDFADTLTPIHDMHICTWDYTGVGPRPGFSYTQATIVSNHGTVTEPSILASYVPDGQIFAPTFVPSGIFSGSPYYYFTPATTFSLTPGANQEFLTTYNVPADIPLGTAVIFKDSVAYEAPIANWLNDYSPWDNVKYFTTTTLGAYDPNFKEVSPKGFGPQGVITDNDSVLEYMVHFQNTGSFMAENVVVKDTLDANLDWTTLRPDFMSANCVVDVNEHGVATFTFNNIDLPPVSSEPITSNGMFTYTIKQKPGLVLGTEIRNHAYIYFDFNTPIVTNSTLNTIGVPSAVPPAPIAAGSSNSFSIFPNPAQTSFTAVINISTGGDYSLTVSDITGKTEINKTLQLQQGTQNINVDAGHLAPGVYFVTFSGAGKIGQTQKLVIMN